MTYNAETALLYRETHREEALAYKKRYREEQREKVAAGKRDWYLRNREHVIAKTKKRAQENPEEEAVRLREWAKAHPEERHAATRQWAQRNPEKIRAQQLLNSAVRAGKLIRPERCEKCGSAERSIAAHHEDYSKPLDVNWLCTRCHATRTAELHNSD